MGGDPRIAGLGAIWALCGICSSLLALAASCSDEVRHDPDETSASAAGAKGAMTSTSAGGAVATGSGGVAGHPVVGGDGGAGDGCTPGNTQCTDCTDNDGDGSIDAWDYECMGFYDDDESLFSHGIPDTLRGCQWDCFFDGDGGSGNDHCSWSAQCDPQSPFAPTCPYDAAVSCPTVGPACVSSCLPVTPNGCDCFGCCDHPAGDGTTLQILVAASTCNQEGALDPALCPPCTRNEACWNPCEPCEYCLGKHELPPECGAVAAPCPGGAPACAPGVACPPAMYCVTGCCIEPVP
jgi:hypothetical protein